MDQPGLKECIGASKAPDSMIEARAFGASASVVYTVWIFDLARLSSAGPDARSLTAEALARMSSIIETGD